MPVFSSNRGILSYGTCNCEYDEIPSIRYDYSLFESFTANDRFFETKVKDFLCIFETKFVVLIRSSLPPFGQSFNDLAQVLNIMKSTNFCEILSLLYGILIHEIDTNNQTITNMSQIIFLLIVIINKQQSMIISYIQSFCSLDIIVF
jgi:hypothetical protein